MSSDRGALINAITDLIQRTSVLTTKMSQTAAGLLGINTTDLRCLQFLQAGPRTAGELARETGLTTASITTALDRLEAGGFVQRVRDTADRRRVLVKLRPTHTREHVAPVFTPLLKRWHAALSDYDDDQLRLIAEAFTKIDDALEAELDEMVD
ncbi:DNA-binding MarR family transcriptional regulator [Herbihabitans rhizosphaerae]|uniref:DNA-binding MarR family transcriptional regulator n=1 Tax=Herbihabitans rhizosphaerae TaxID=1872711 RepID=A0A4V2ESJ5_9PSEU|nr:MarR family transcriptional regulator [Herbihabitans rhizosphaerae]RZS37793.1 DNA-binding MarR family transcriptional regulator [Herbihabitans rhizosphaerae]